MAENTGLASCQSFIQTFTKPITTKDMIDRTCAKRSRAGQNRKTDPSPEEKGLKPVPLYGVERTVIAVIGDERILDEHNLASLSRSGKSNARSPAIKAGQQGDKTGINDCKVGKVVK